METKIMLPRSLRCHMALDNLSHLACTKSQRVKVQVEVDEKSAELWPKTDEQHGCKEKNSERVQTFSRFLQFVGKQLGFESSQNGFASRGNNHLLVL